MTRDTYIRMTTATGRLLGRLPGGTHLLPLPTLACAGAYLFTLLHLMLARDIRLIRVLLVPAVCFVVCTVLRPLIGRQRPYDHFDARPVGSYKPGKSKSMPSRHTASAAAIALAVAYVYPFPAVIAGMAILCALIAGLRVLCGQHYPSDVLAALLLSLVISVIGYILI